MYIKLSRASNQLILNYFNSFWSVFCRMWKQWYHTINVGVELKPRIFTWLPSIVQLIPYYLDGPWPMGAQTAKQGWWGTGVCTITMQYASTPLFPILGEIGPTNSLKKLKNPLRLTEITHYAPNCWEPTVSMKPQSDNHVKLLNTDSHQEYRQLLGYPLPNCQDTQVANIIWSDYPE